MDFVIDAACALSGSHVEQYGHCQPMDMRSARRRRACLAHCVSSTVGRATAAAAPLWTLSVCVPIDRLELDDGLARILDHPSEALFCLIV